MGSPPIGPRRKALFAAVRAGDAPLLAALMEGSELSPESLASFLALAASGSSRAPCLELLLAFWPDVDAVVTREGAGAGYRLMDYAAQCDAAPCLELLLARGASVELRGPYGLTPYLSAGCAGARGA